MKKNLAKLLAVSVSMGMLTACGGNGGKTETTAAETKAAETTAAETKAEETKETETTAAERKKRNSRPPCCSAAPPPFIRSCPHWPLLLQRNS